MTYNSQFAAASALILSRDVWIPVDGILWTVWRPRPQACDRVRRIPSTASAINLKKKAGLGSNYIWPHSGLLLQDGSAEGLSERVRAEPGRQMSFGAFLQLT